MMTVRVAESWVERPLRRFVDDARVMYALVLHPSGQVVGQHGFTRAVDVMSACALAAGINASSAALGRELQNAPFRELHVAGADRQLYLTEATTAQGPLVVLTVFDRTSSLGLVRLYATELRTALAESSPSEAGAPVMAADFERELGRSLAAMFGRAEVKQ